LRAANRKLQFFCALGALLLLAGCATPPADPAARAEFNATNDPLEPMNRTIFSVNDVFYTYLIRPVAKTYTFVFPQFTRNMMRNFLNNLGEPVVFANDLMQGQFHRADITTGRFLANSTVGIGGLFDVATSTGLPEQSGDFGQTLYRYGVPAGPYLVLPILGPSNPRDAIGMGVDSEMDPFGYLASDYGHGGATWYRYIAYGIDEYSRESDALDDLKKNSLDYYAAMRSLSRQHRDAALRDGKPSPVSDMGGLYNDPASKK
jgi:phospholipid-binding lipoprotein MlaA